MLKHLKIYKILLNLNFSTLTAYRANFTNSLIASVGWGIFSVLSMLLVTSKTPIVFGWKREELLILVGAYSIVVGIFHMVFSRNFDRFSRIINRGELDVILTKPLDSQFLLSLWIFNYASFIRIIMGIIFTLYMVQKIGISIGFLEMMGFFLLGFIGLVLLYSLWFLAIATTIWFSRLSNLTELMNTITGISRQPPEMFKEFSSYVFIFLLPLTLIVVAPTRFLLQKATWQEVLLLFLFSVIFFCLSRKFWKFALRFYTSAGG